MIKRLISVSILVLLLGVLVGCYSYERLESFYVTDVDVSGYFVLSGTVWEDLKVDIPNVKFPAALPPTDMPYQGSHVPAFVKDANNVLYFVVQLPHSYKEGTDVSFHIHLVYPTAGAGDSVWYFTHSWANTGGVFPAATSATVTSTSPGVANQSVLLEVVDLVGTGKLISSVILCSISRSGALLTDTFDDWVYLVGADFYYKVDTVGSSSKGSK